jgi:hypothetical protein
MGNNFTFYPYQCPRVKIITIMQTRTDPNNPVNQQCCHCAGGTQYNLRMTGNTSTDHLAMERQQRLECAWVPEDSYD